MHRLVPYHALMSVYISNLLSSTQYLLIGAFRQVVEQVAGGLARLIGARGASADTGDGRRLDRIDGAIQRGDRRPNGPLDSQ